MSAICTEVRCLVSMFADSLSGGDLFVARDLLALGAFAFLRRNRATVRKRGTPYPSRDPRVSLEGPNSPGSPRY